MWVVIALLIPLLGSEKVEVRDWAEDKLSVLPFTETDWEKARKLRVESPEIQGRLNRISTIWTRRLLESLPAFSIWPDVDYCEFTSYPKYESEELPEWGTLWRRQPPTNVSVIPFIWQRRETKATLTRYLIETGDVKLVKAWLDGHKVDRFYQPKIIYIRSVPFIHQTTNFTTRIAYAPDLLVRRGTCRVLLDRYERFLPVWIVP